MRRSTIFGSVLVLVGVILPLVAAAPAPALPPPIQLCSASSALSSRPFATASDYSSIRARIADPMNFGPGGTVPRTVNIVEISTIDSASLTGCEVIVLMELLSAPSSSSLTAIDNAVLAGARLIVDSDSFGTGTAGLNAVFGSFGGSRGANANAICPNGTVTVANNDDGATHGPFGDLRGGTFGTSLASTVLPAATDNVDVDCPGAMRVVIPAGGLGTGSGIVMAGGDVSAHNIFASYVNYAMYMNVIAGPAVTTTDLTISKTCPANALPGDQITCSVTVNNTGSIDAQNVSVSDTVPSGETLVGTPSGGGFTCGTANPIVCTRATLPGGQSATFSYTVQISSDAPSGSSFTNTATVSTTTAESNTTNNTATATTSFPACTINFSNATSGQTIRGTAGNDVICGSQFADSIQGLGGNDIIFGNGGNDNIQGNDGNDKLFGGAGDDTLVGPPGVDSANGGSGFDRCTSQSNTNCEQAQIA